MAQSPVVLFSLLKPRLSQGAASQHNKLLSREKTRGVGSCAFQGESATLSHDLDAVSLRWFSLSKFLKLYP